MRKAPEIRESGAQERARMLRGLRVVGVWGAILVLGLSGCVTSEGGDEHRDRNPKAETAREVGIDHLAKGRLALAIRQLTLSVTLEPGDPQTHHWLGEAYRRKGKLDDAERHALEALELEPGYHGARLNLSALYSQRERYEEAIVQADILIDDPLFPYPWRALNNRGWAYYKLDELTEARTSYEEALDFRPEYWPAVLNLGIVARDRGNNRKAVEYFEQVLGMSTGVEPKAEAYYRLGELYVAMGDRPKARGYFDASLDSAPHGNWAKQSKRYLKMLR